MAGVDTEERRGAEQTADAESADSEAEIADISVQRLFHQHRAKDDDRPAKGAGQKDREQRATQMGGARDLAYAGEEMTRIA